MFSSAVFLQTDSRASDSCVEPYVDASQNAKGMFRPEHCVWFSVLVRNIIGLEKGERYAYLLR